MCCVNTIQDIQTHIVLNPTNVGNNFLLEAHIKDKLVNKVKKNNHQRLIPNISPGIIIIAFAPQLKNSTVL
jgi:hypothetical protein